MNIVLNENDFLKVLSEYYSNLLGYSVQVKQREGDSNFDIIEFNEYYGANPPLPESTFYYANEKNKNVIVTWNEICEVMSDYFKAKGFVIDNYVVNRFFNDYTTLSDVTTISYIESIQFNLKKINNKRRCL